VIGGGTGIFPVTSALKHLDVAISTIVAVSDSGGSTGRIRDEFGFQPVGDLRQSLAALAENRDEAFIRKLLLYRFEKGEGLKGHNLGNLILTALQDLTGSTTEALRQAGRMFHLEGAVIPATETTVDLKITYTDGSTQIGEHILDEKPTHPKTIAKVELVPAATSNPLATATIAQADLIIVGPGDMYASLFAALLPQGMQTALKTSTAPIVYIANLMTRLTQTHNWSLNDHVTHIEQMIGRACSTVVVNSQPIPDPITTAYTAEQEFPVVDDMVEDPRILREPIIADATWQNTVSDSIQRSLLRHDSTKLQSVLRQLIEKVKAA
jgi:uncharacterized cofD-like protein